VLPSIRECTPDSTSPHHGDPGTLMCHRFAKAAISASDDIPEKTRQ
jgi:hypothetical protein